MGNVLYQLALFLIDGLSGKVFSIFSKLVYAGKTGPKLTFKYNFFLQTKFITVYLSLPFILIKNGEPEQGDQSLVFLNGTL